MRKPTSGLYGALAGAALLGATALPDPAKAEPAVTAGIGVACPLTGPGVLACAGAGLLLHEAVMAGSGRNTFGENGEVMRLLATPVRIVGSNIKAAERESGAGAQVLRGALGISIRDIERYGLVGGPTSVFKKFFG